MCKHEKKLIKTETGKVFHACVNKDCGYLFDYIDANKYMVKNNLDFNGDSLEEVN
tara:strand:+ start:231 stop:395 length:165 start_codon:yes stop_codon:yes gene_type:complete